jgi:hypothetical protein
LKIFLKLKTAYSSGFFYCDRQPFAKFYSLYSVNPCMKKYFPVLSFILVVMFSCSKGGSDGGNTTGTGTGTGGGGNNTSCTGTKTFSSDVSPIIQGVCASSGCHNAGSTNGPGALTNYQQVFNARANIRSAVSSGTMPKNSSLTASQKNAIICWIDNGALDN